jgi:hypothetical protein
MDVGLKFSAIKLSIFIIEVYLSESTHNSKLSRLIGDVATREVGAYVDTFDRLSLWVYNTARGSEVGVKLCVGASITRHTG